VANPPSTLEEMRTEIARLEPLVPTAIEDARKVRSAIAERIPRNGQRSEEDVRREAWSRFYTEHPDLRVAEMIAKDRAKGLDDDRIAQELLLVVAQGLW
jgi:hypothetical protein